ncbi:hypothetical protein SBI_09800 [Streptomyces bingchenggensis BCW-1]|uniref:Rv2525c-like glycoside hydrolase-like domain-containing protein n=1 Tax=Streptomyces bingchenggensis (strain BCW-1) TaxID=749414 RepID=D7CBP1_STRBB|nr:MULTISPECIES: glycoside hydrolase domain-containing protein [Streptomyces]ADI12918.1 hypothetical protein SBI_09800 [Streptomyces bingchenggensis BCW-1]
MQQWRPDRLFPPHTGTVPLPRERRGGQGGGQARQGEACDGVTKITPARAQALKDAGYKYIGRHLYYSVEQGAADCLHAAAKAEEHGYKPGSRIYFAVDYDAVNDKVTSYILPYFRSIKEQMGRLGSPYKIGVYGPRNACSRISEEGYADTRFVSDMSSGFSGNLGYAMPENWAFGQIVTKWVGSGNGRIEIDNNIASGRDQPPFSPGTGASMVESRTPPPEVNAVTSQSPERGRVFRRCGCRRPDGRQFGAGCPRLQDGSRHGS